MGSITALGAITGRIPKKGDVSKKLDRHKPPATKPNIDCEMVQVPVSELLEGLVGLGVNPVTAKYFINGLRSSAVNQVPDTTFTYNTHIWVEDGFPEGAHDYKCDGKWHPYKGETRHHVTILCSKGVPFQLQGGGTYIEHLICVADSYRTLNYMVRKTKHLVIKQLELVRAGFGRDKDKEQLRPPIADYKPVDIRSKNFEATCSIIDGLPHTKPSDRKAMGINVSKSKKGKKDFEPEKQGTIASPVATTQKTPGRKRTATDAGLTDTRSAKTSNSRKGEPSPKSVPSSKQKRKEVLDKQPVTVQSVTQPSATQSNSAAAPLAVGTNANGLMHFFEAAAATAGYADMQSLMVALKMAAPMYTPKARPSRKVPKFFKQPTPIPSDESSSDSDNEDEDEQESEDEHGSSPVGSQSGGGENFVPTVNSSPSHIVKAPSPPTKPHPFFTVAPLGIPCPLGEDSILKALTNKGEDKTATTPTKTPTHLNSTGSAKSNKKVHGTAIEQVTIEDIPMPISSGDEPKKTPNTKPRQAQEKLNTQHSENILASTKTPADLAQGRIDEDMKALVKRESDRKKQEAAEKKERKQKEKENSQKEGSSHRFLV